VPPVLPPLGAAVPPELEPEPVVVVPVFVPVELCAGGVLGTAGAAAGGTVVLVPPPPPPLEAMTMITIRKNAAPVRAARRRRL
jgi:hypothetical protein